MTTSNIISPEVKEKLDQREDICRKIEASIGKIDEAAIKEVQTLVNEWKGAEEIPFRFFEILDKRFQQAQVNFFKAKETREKEISIIEERKSEIENCLEKLENSAKNENVLSESESVDKLVEKWKRLTDDLQFIDDYRQRFENLYDCFKEKKALQEKHTREEIQAKTDEAQALSKDLKKLIETQDATDISDQVKEIHDIWKDIKPIVLKGKPEAGGTNHKKLVDKIEQQLKIFYDQLRSDYQEREWKRWENYTHKLSLCDKAEALAGEENHRKVAETVRLLRDNWKKLGAVPREKSEEIWARFDKACTFVYERAQKFFAELKVERKENLKIKLDLCEQVEALKDSTDWTTTADQLKELQVKWKATGSVPKEHDQEVYQRFSKACNHYFTNRKNHFQVVKDVQNEHRQHKIEICEEAEKLVDMDQKEAFAKIREFRDRWKRAGSAQRKHEQKLWERFNIALDAFFAKIDAEKPENLKKKSEICLKIKELAEKLTDDCVLEDIDRQFNSLSAEWKRVGTVPKENDKESFDAFKLATSHFHDKRGEIENNLMSKKQQGFADKLIHIRTLEKAFEKNEGWDSLQSAVAKVAESWAVDGSKDVLDRLFEDIKKAIESQNAGFYKTLLKEYQKNLRKKVDLCVRLERLADISAPDVELGNSSAMSLAEELKFSIESNFSQPQKMDRKEVEAEFKNVREKWDKLGPVPRSDEDSINKRYARAFEEYNKRH